jgi:class 3 adenylate cyclase
MKKLGVIIFLLCSLIAYPKEKSGVLLLTKDSLQHYQNYISKFWKFSEGDDSAMASMSYNDSQWKEVNPYLEFSDTAKTTFKGIGWFRLHFIADTTVTGKPLAMTMTHFGASEIYIDGKLINSFGTIKGADSSEYYDPREVPFIFTVTEAGEHVLAVRYANYNAEKNFKIYMQSRAGFEMMLGIADDYVFNKNQRSTILSFMLMLLSGIFLALGVIHLFLYFYHRADRSNLFFSIFMFCIALLFMIGFIGYASTTPSLALKTFFLLNPVTILACISLSGFIKELFFKKNWRFIIIIVGGVISFLMNIFGMPVYIQVTAGLIISVSIEAVFTIIFGMIKRVKGARIIGTGILFFTLFILTLFGIAMARGGNFHINDSTTSGVIWEFFLALAVISIPVSMSLYQAWRFASINKDLGLQLEQVKVLSQKTLEQELEKKNILESQKEKLEEEVMLRTAELRTEKKKSDDLLLNILPSEVADELKEKGSSAAKHFDEVTVLFTDFKNFTLVSEQMSPQELVNEINFCYSEFDKIISTHGIEKIKTIGDAYMCAGGLPVPNRTNAEDTVKAAIDILNFMLKEKEKRKVNGKSFFEIRIGIHTGPVVAGIVGIKKFAYDIWGDTVNIASRMESSGEAGKVNISGATYELVKDKFKCEPRGKVSAKNKGEIDMYYVEQKN